MILPFSNFVLSIFRKIRICLKMLFKKIKPIISSCFWWWWWNCFCGMVDLRKEFGLIFSRDHCQRSSPSRISDRARAGFEPTQNLSSGFVEWSCPIVITTTIRRQKEIIIKKLVKHFIQIVDFFNRSNQHRHFW